MLRRFSLSAFLGLAVLATGGCSTSNVPGPQLKDVPADFGLDRDPEVRRTVFENLPLLQRRAYYLRGDEGTASIVLSEFEGEISKRELDALRVERAEQWARSGVVFSDLEDVPIDNQDSWIWYERAERNRRLVGVVPYPDDQRIWTVDFYTTVQRLADDALMFRHVTSFALDPQADERGPVTAFFFLFFSIAVLVAWYFRRARQYRRRRKTT